MSDSKKDPEEQKKVQTSVPLSLTKGTIHGLIEQDVELPEFFTSTKENVASSSSSTQLNIQTGSDTVLANVESSKECYQQPLKALEFWTNPEFIAWLQNIKGLEEKAKESLKKFTGYSFQLLMSDEKFFKDEFPDMQTRLILKYAYSQLTKKLENKAEEFATTERSLKIQKVIRKVDISRESPITIVSTLFFEVNKIFLEDSGLFCEKNVILYERDGFREEVQFLEKEVICNSRWGWIIGLPGCGKSITVYFYLLTKVRTSEWEITWIHLSRNDNPMFVQFHGNQEKCSGILENVDQLTTLLGNSPKRHILVLDGLTDSLKDKEIQLKCRAWHVKDLTNRRFVIVSSMTARGKYNPEDDVIQKVKVHTVYSWKLEEYQETVKDQKFLESTKEYLDASIMDLTSESSKITPDDQITSKYYFAGGSSRLMFCFKTQDVVALLDESIQAVHDVNQYIFGTVGIESKLVVNRLFNAYKGKSNSTIVSEYAASELALKLGPRLVENLYQAIKNTTNPALDGWMLEIWFFAAIKYEGVKMFDRTKNVVSRWPKSAVLNFDPMDMSKDVFIRQTQIWLKPLKWNQGGYDAVYVDTNQNLLRFVQITRGSSHSLKLGYFASCLQKIQKIPGFQFQVESLEIYFLVPNSIIKDFQLEASDITGQGALEDRTRQDWGWKKYDEQNQVKIRGIQGLDI